MWRPSILPRTSLGSQTRRGFPGNQTDGEEDVTSKFPKAKAAGLKVFKGEDGLTVRDGKKDLNDEPVKTKKQVDAIVAEHDDEEEDDEDDD